MTVRDHMHPEVGGLGRKIEKQKEEPQPVEISPGVFRGPDGKLFTELPLPPLNQPGPWPFPLSKP